MHYRLAASGVLAAWETGAARRPLDRAMAILWAAGAAEDVDAADLPLAERDRRLLTIRAETFGPLLPARATCPSCKTELEMEIDARRLAEALPRAEHADSTIRPLTSRDLAAIAEVPADELAAALRARVVRRDFTDAETPALDRRIEAQAGAAELSVRMSCAECGTEWSETLDVIAHLWADVEASARQLLGEVAELAAAFGWSEQAILSLSPARRATYLSWARQA